MNTISVEIFLMIKKNINNEKKWNKKLGILKVHNYTQIFEKNFTIK